MQHLGSACKALNVYALTLIIGMRRNRIAYLALFDATIVQVLVYVLYAIHHFIFLAHLLITSAYVKTHIFVMGIYAHHVLHNARDAKEVGIIIALNVKVVILFYT